MAKSQSTSNAARNASRLCENCKKVGVVMNYYPFHLGDYASHTGHLDHLEDLAYRRMLDAYYLRESPLPVDVVEIARLIRMRQNLTEVEAVLREFFVLNNEGWSHSRCDEEINRMRDKQAKARASAAASVNARKAKAQPPYNERLTDAQRTLNESQADVELPTPTPTPTPIVNKGTNVPVGKAALPPVEFDRVVDLYHQALPELPAVRLMNDSRKRAIASMWKFVLTSKKSDGTPRAGTSAEAKEWLKGYFLRVRENDFLMGRSAKANGHEGWVCDFDFLLSEKGKKHVIEKTQVAA